jgi:SPP1 gp7 family putative phage head morphogenesis protein
MRSLRKIWAKAWSVIERGLEKIYPFFPTEDRTDIGEIDRFLSILRELPKEKYGELYRAATSGARAPRIRNVDPTQTRVPSIPPDIDDLSPSSIQMIIEWMDSALQQTLTIEYILPIIDTVIRKSSKHVAADLSRILRIPIRDIVGQRIVDTFRETNIALIESGIWGEYAQPSLRGKGLLPDVSETIEQAHAQGLRVEELRKTLMDRFGVSKSRADLIARDQVLKLNGQVNQHRQQQVGIMEYTWSTSRDERVRDAHQDLQGKTYRWDTPPDVGRGRNLNPGQDYQCRCIGIPVAPAWLDG